MVNKTDGRTTDTKQRILKEARRLYLKGGYAGISLKEIALQLEISKPALFHHFKSKQELFYAVMLDIGENIQQTVAEAMSQGADSRSRLRNVMLAMRRQPFFDPMKFLNEEISELSEAQQKHVSGYYQGGLQGAVMQILAEGVRSQEFRDHNLKIAAMAFTNLMMLLPSPGSPLTRYMPDQDTEAYIDELLTLFIEGLRNN